MGLEEGISDEDCIENEVADLTKLAQKVGHQLGKSEKNKVVVGTT